MEWDTPMDRMLRERARRKPVRRLPRPLKAEEMEAGGTGPEPEATETIIILPGPRQS